MEQKKIFISYSRDDGQQFATDLANNLRTAGADVWLDQLDIQPGKIWDLEIEKALNAADAVLLIVTNESVISTHVLDEVYYAIDEKKEVIPVIFHNCKMPYRINRLQYIDFTGDYNKAFNQLLKTGVKTVLSKNEPTTQEINPVEKENFLDGGKQVDPINKYERAAPQTNLPHTIESGKSKMIWLAAGGLLVALALAAYFVFSPGKTGISSVKTIPDTANSKPVLDSGKIIHTDSVAKNEPDKDKKKTAPVTDKLIEKKPDTNKIVPPVVTHDYNYYFNQGMQYLGERNYVAAMDNFEQAVKVKPDADAAFFQAGNAAARLKNYPQAFTYYAKAIRLQPASIEYYNIRAGLYRGQQQYAHAITDFDIIIRLEPGNQVARFYRGECKRMLNDLTGACADFKEAASKGNGNASFSYSQYCPVKTTTPTRFQPIKVQEIKANKAQATKKITGN